MIVGGTTHSRFWVSRIVEYFPPRMGLVNVHSVETGLGKDSNALVGRHGVASLIFEISIRTR